MYHLCCRIIEHMLVLYSIWHCMVKLLSVITIPDNGSHFAYDHRHVNYILQGQLLLFQELYVTSI